jgi:hypothetical protein
VKEFKMAYTRAADGIASKGKTKGKNLGDSGKAVGIMSGGKGKGGGKTNANMKSMGRNLAKVAAQERG